MADEPNTIDTSGLEGILQLANQNMSQLIQTVKLQFPAMQATYSSLSIVNSTTGGTTAYIGAGYLVATAVLVPSTGLSGTIYDANSPVNVSSTNAMTLIPSSGNSVYAYPFTNGLTVQPSTSGSQAVAIYYRKA